MIDVADFVKKDISIDKSAVTFYTGTFYKQQQNK